MFVFRNLSLDLVQKHPKIETPRSRRHSMNIFMKFRINKQDKIAANVAQHIRAVRAAEDLDRRTHLRKTDSAHFGIGSAILPVQRIASTGPDSPGHDKKRLVGMLKQHYEQVAEEVCIRTEDVACQTSYDLLEALLPSLRRRMNRSETMMSTLTPEEEEAKYMYKVENYCKYPFYGDSYRHHSICGSNHASINMAYDNASPRSRGAAGQKSKSHHRGERIEVEYKISDENQLDDYDVEEVISLREMKRTKALQLLGKKSQYNKLQAVLSGNADMASLNLPQEGISEASFSPTISQDSLIDATSSIIEESASTGSDDTPGSAVYKNIIINLGGTQDRRGHLSASHSSANSAANLNFFPMLSDTRSSQSQESEHDGLRRYSPDVTKWQPANGNAQNFGSRPSGDS